MEPVKIKKNIIVVGGGLAGMEAAKTLALRGHQVQLHEKEQELGGQWRAAAAPEANQSYRTLIPSLQAEMERAGVAVYLGSVVTKQSLEQMAPDYIILATGATVKQLHIPGEAVAPQTVTGIDVLLGKETIVDKKVVVIGGRYIGMEVAAMLAEEGNHVSLVEAGEIGQNTISRLFTEMRNRMVAAGVFLYAMSPVLRFTATGVDIANGKTLLHLDADVIVLAVGTEPEQTLQKQLESSNFAFCAIGDCEHIGDALDAIAAGAEVGRRI